MNTFLLLNILLYVTIGLCALGILFLFITFWLLHKYKPKELKRFIREESYRLANRKKVIVTEIPPETKAFLDAVYRPLPDNVSAEGWIGSIGSSS